MKAVETQTQTQADTCELRPLTETELDNVNGGFIFVVGLLALGFEAGFLGGVIAANYSETGNFWGDI